MGLSDSETEARLAALRRERESLDREIADLMLYLELGRRLSRDAPASGHEPAAAIPRKPTSVPSQASPVATREAGDPIPMRSPEVEGANGPADQSPPKRGEDRAYPVPQPSRHGTSDADGTGIPPAVGFTQDPSGARRYGRALMEAACARIAEVGRPLHAGEILDHLTTLGFSLPGRDPVAALNTRLWKRAGPGGPLRRVGEATYALAE